MIVVDNFFPPQVINNVLEKSINYSWNFMRSDANQDSYWSKHICGMFYGDNTYFNYLSNHQEIKECWDFIKNKLNVGDENLEACYLNCLTHGLEAHAHIDSMGNDDYVTLICYVCDAWNSHWCGETCFYDMEYSSNPADIVYYSHDIIKSVLPRNNRVVMFDGSVVHSVRPLSKSFKGLRVTLMFKLKNVNIKEIEQNAT